MECRSLRENRSYQNDVLVSRTRRSENRSPHLPTPEYSRSSHDTFDSEDARENSQRQLAGFHPGSQFMSQGPSIQSATSDRNTSQERDRMSPRAPRYAASNAQKPSLPPLKTVSQSSGSAQFSMRVTNALSSSARIRQLRLALPAHLQCLNNYHQGSQALS